MDWGHMLNVEGWVWAQDQYARVYVITLKTSACKTKKEKYKQYCCLGEVDQVH